MVYETAIVLGTQMSAFTFAYLSSKFSAEHQFLQALFIFMALAVMIGSSGMMAELGTVNSVDANLVGLLGQNAVIVIYGFYIAIAYYVVMYVYRVFISMTQRNKAMRRVQL